MTETDKPDWVEMDTFGGCDGWACWAPLLVLVTMFAAWTGFCVWMAVVT